MFELHRPVSGFAFQSTSLDTAAAYLERLGLNPTPLWEKARDKGWEVEG